MPPTDLKQRIFLAAVTALGLEACSADESEPITAEPQQAPTPSTAGTETPMAPPPPAPEPVLEVQAQEENEAEAEADDEARGEGGGGGPAGRVARPARQAPPALQPSDSVAAPPREAASCGASCGAECGGTPADDE